MRSLRLFTVFAVFLWLQCIAHAQEPFPRKPVRLVVSTAPGGGTDTIARVVAQGLSERWRQSVVVENKTGASGNIAGQFVARSSPDGYNLLVSFGGSATINPLNFKDMGFDPLKDLVPVINMATSPMFVVINPAVVPSRTMNDFIAYAKSSPAPLSWASTQPASADALAGQMFGLMANVQLTHIPYKGGGEAFVDVLAGRVPFGVFSMTAAGPYLRTGQLVALGVTERTRSSMMPQVAPIHELIPGYEASTWYGVWAPAGTPPDLVAKINADIRQVLQGEAVRRRAPELGLELIGNSPDEMAAAIRAELQRHQKVIRALGPAAKS